MSDGINRKVLDGEEIDEPQARRASDGTPPAVESLPVRVLSGDALGEETWLLARVIAEAQGVSEGDAVVYYSPEAFAHVYMRPEPPSVALALAIGAERDRRLSSLVVAFQGRTFQARASDMIELNGHVAAALGAVAAGAELGDLRWSDSADEFAWLDAANVPIPMDAQSLLALTRAAAMARSAVIRAARRMKDQAGAGELFDPCDEAMWPAA